jgi:hypothetical protein
MEPMVIIATLRRGMLQVFNTSPLTPYNSRSLGIS